MVHTSKKHQPNWFKFARLLYHKLPKCVIAPVVLVSMATGTSQILLGYKNMWFFEYKMKFYIFNSSSISRKCPRKHS